MAKLFSGYTLTDEERAVTELLLPKGGRGPQRVDHRQILNGIFYFLSGLSGNPQRDLNIRFPPLGIFISSTSDTVHDRNTTRA